MASTSALAHSGVMNPVVKARMGAMGTIADNTKVLGSMAKGEVAFDAPTARQAAGAIAEQAARISMLFQEPATDPKSEALPAIWQSYDSFESKAADLEKAAALAAANIEAETDLRPALTAIGGACKSCHQIYRIKR